MSNGWILLSRNLPNHWLWNDADRLKWWLDLLFMAAWEEKQVMEDTHLITLRRGQLIASISFLSKRWNRSAPTVLLYIKMLENENMLYRTTLYGKVAIITICNYERYQAQEGTKLDSTLYGTLDSTLYSTLDTNKRNKRNIYISSDNISSDNKLSSDIILSSDITSSSDDEVNVDYEKLAKFFNSKLGESKALIPRIREIKHKRRMAVNARVREHSKKELFEVINKAAVSDFLNGRNERSFTATFDWLMCPNNFVKVLEGNYDNRTNENHTNGNSRKSDKEVRDAEVAELIARLAAEDDAEQEVRQ